MPQNPNKTKGEILSELESIKGLLIEEDDIPILQEIEHQDFDPIDLPYQTKTGTQTSIFDDLLEEITPLPLHPGAYHSPQSSHRPVPKAMGENPFLPQHIRDRLQGNNPPPIFDFDMSQQISNAYKIGKSYPENRHDLVNDLIKRYLPQIEQELRLKLLAMTEDELKKL